MHFSKFYFSSNSPHFLVKQVAYLYAQVGKSTTTLTNELNCEPILVIALNTHMEFYCNDTLKIYI